MAGDWIKMRTELHTHPKIVRIASALSADRLRVIGALHATWCLFDVHSTDGVLDGYSLKTLDDMINFPGFAQAMTTVGWLEETESTLCMPRFFEHNGQSAKRRAQDADRKRNTRKTSAPEADKKRTREEKRREDINPSLKGVDENLITPPEPQNPPENFDPEPWDFEETQLGKFPVAPGWKPSADFRQRAATWGVILPEPPYQASQLAEFIGYWQPEGKSFHQAQWEQKFARHVQRVGSPPGPAPAKRQSLDWDNTDWMEPIAGQVNDILGGRP
jgi:hypothetical protein